MNTPSILIQFDPNSFRPLMVLPVTDTDVETAKILELANRMLAAIVEDPENVPS